MLPRAPRHHHGNAVRRAWAAIERPRAVSVDDDSRGARSSRSSSPAKYGSKSPFRPARQEPLLARVIPVAGDLPGYRFPGARRDLVVGVTVAALAVPAAMAYAELAGLSPVNGLYALLLPSVAYLLLGSSRQLIIGRGRLGVYPDRRGDRAAGRPGER
jgi:hypothetical protein